MKFIFLFLTFTTFSYLLADEPRIFQQIKKDSGAIILKDLNTNRLIISKDENKSLRPASLTKIMTCILAIESGKMDSVVTITTHMTEIDPTIINVKVGEQFYLKDFVVRNCKLVKSQNKPVGAFALYLCFKILCINGIYGCFLLYGILAFLDVSLKAFDKFNVIVYI